ncbi:MAG: glyoxalase [Candidatus Dactylopiibacterium carminicum]|uniref:Glyoxalase n=1 Tax=Candidatus Dactylopiibacterium carminicum TaxID=857335 RepID=A0A272EQV9_9RHOO|nr:glyoxalase [Candidatus Dactylopiibacterium carminicum]PAS92100.1 MAG: glyoxalase [Candidatus Dactylopiibacterium carminicum]PAS95522.1 MAG: glyoxalase [Candidatus Dactylopiibacterium carminicum]PAS97904.1 MAG: glyoxalase [Candidatus Dactylopiibacterium carminicum]
MQLEHIAIWADDLDALCAFYARYFGAETGPRYENSAKGFSSRFLGFGHGARIEVMQTTALALARHESGAQRHGLTHLALSLGSESAVDALTARLLADGYSVLDGPRRTGDGYYESVVLDPEGNRLELTA